MTKDTNANDDKGGLLSELDVILEPMYLHDEKCEICTYIVSEAKAQIQQLLEDKMAAYQKELLDDYEEDVAARVLEARIDENQRRLDKIIEYENRTPVPGELTSASFGSAGAAMEVSGFKRSFEERIVQLNNQKGK